MTVYAARGRAGCVEVRRRRSTGLEVGIYRAADAGLDSDPENPWAVVCEPHGRILTTETLRLARWHAAEPAGWCGVCSGEEVVDDSGSSPPDAGR